MDEEFVLVTAPSWAARLKERLAADGPAALHAVPPHYLRLCLNELASGALTSLLEPDDPPINAGYLVQRPGRPDNPDVVRVSNALLEAGRTW